MKQENACFSILGGPKIKTNIEDMSGGLNMGSESLKGALQFPMFPERVSGYQCHIKKRKLH